MQFFNVKKPIAFFYVTRLLKLFLFDKTVVGFAGYIWKLNVMFMRLGRHLCASGDVFAHWALKPSHQMLL
jgi:hypothetical protein